MSFDQLYQQHYARVVDFLLRRGLAREDAYDLAQDTFLRVYRGMGEFRGEAKDSTWILRIATNVLLNWRRDNHAGKRHGHLVPLDDLLGTCGALDLAPAPGFRPEPESPELGILRQEQNVLVREAVETLPPRMRESVKLRQRGLKYREIAGTLQVSIETVKVQLHNAKKIVAARLQGRRRPKDEDGS